MSDDSAFCASSTEDVETEQPVGRATSVQVGASENVTGPAVFQLLFRTLNAEEPVVARSPSVCGVEFGVTATL